ncbi:hypothetical protein KKC13_08810 [bacterium]|nr:hypothetical protein [bacterium]MBU1958634.1 hypothetical protein [bacterium]
MENKIDKQSMLLTQSICDDFLFTFEMQSNKEIKDIEKLFLLICDYVANRNKMFYDELSGELQAFFTLKVKKQIDKNNSTYFEKAKKRMIVADLKRKESDKEKGITNNYVLNFDNIKPITKLTLYFDDIRPINNVVHKNIIVNEDFLNNNPLLILMQSVFDYVLHGDINLGSSFHSSFAGFAFKNIKKQIDKHELLYTTKVENINKKTKKEKD